jgi:hypothetical protein
MFKDLQKFIKANHIVALVGLILLAVFVSQYSGRKGNVYDNMENNNNNNLSSSVNVDEIVARYNKRKSQNNVNEPFQTQLNTDNSNISPALPMGQNESYSDVTGIGNPSALVNVQPSCARQPVANPEDLLPRDENSQWAQLNPRGVGDLNNVNLLEAGFWNGINSVGSSLRNANLQIRSEPPNPQTQVSPWMNTTIEPDMMRLPLEIGGAR